MAQRRIGAPAGTGRDDVELDSVEVRLRSVVVVGARERRLGFGRRTDDVERTVAHRGGLEPIGRAAVHADRDRREPWVGEAVGKLIERTVELDHELPVARSAHAGERLRLPKHLRGRIAGDGLQLVRDIRLQRLLRDAVERELEVARAYRVAVRILGRRDRKRPRLPVGGRRPLRSRGRFHQPRRGVDLGQGVEDLGNDQDRPTSRRFRGVERAEVADRDVERPAGVWRRRRVLLARAAGQQGEQNGKRDGAVGQGAGSPAHRYLMR